MTLWRQGESRARAQVSSITGNVEPGSSGGSPHGRPKVRVWPQEPGRPYMLAVHLAEWGGRGECVGERERRPKSSGVGGHQRSSATQGALPVLPT